MSKSISTVLVLLLGASFAAGQIIQERRKVSTYKVPVESGISEQVLQAEQAIEDKKYQEAERLLRQAVEKNTEDARAWFDLGYVLMLTERATEAAAAYRKSLALKEDVFETNLNLGLLLAQAGDEEAAKYLRFAAKLQPKRSKETTGILYRAWMGLGQRLGDSKPQGALEAYREAIELNPESGDAHLAAALLLERQKELKSAEEQYQKVLALAPESAEALVGLINIYVQTERLPEAEQALTRYLALNPQSAQAHAQHGKILMALGRSEEAQVEFDAALRLDPDDPQALAEIANAQLAAGEPAAAEKYYRRLVERSPQDAGMRRQLAISLMKQLNYAEAESELLKVVRLDPQLGEAYLDLAMAASQNQHYELSLQALESYRWLLPEVPLSYFLRAIAFDHLRAPEQAAENYRQFLAVAGGRFPDQEWQARHRLIAIDPEARKKNH